MTNFDRGRAKVLAIWMRAKTPAEAHSLIRKNIFKLGVTPWRVQVYPCIVDDGVIDVIVEVGSRKDAQLLKAAIRRACRMTAGVSRQTAARGRVRSHAEAAAVGARGVAARGHDLSGRPRTRGR